MKNIKNCKVEIVSIYTNYTEDSSEKLTFDEIITDEEVNNQEYSIRGKIINLSIKENNEEYIIGFLTSSIDKDLPAKINKNTKEISALDLSDEEGIAYGSAFLYSKKLNVLFYEINRNSLYLDAFKEFIYRCYNGSQSLKNRTIFDLKFLTIFRKNEYERALRMDLYKSFKLKVYQPKKLLKDIERLNSSLDQKIETEFLSDIERASSLNSEFAEISFNVTRPKSEGGLLKDKIETIISNFKKVLNYGEIRDKIEQIEIKGYDEDFSKRVTPIDLVGDVYSSGFKLEVPRLDKNLQKNERINKIKEVYVKERKILESFI